jgi:hypothetical protein
VRALLKTLQAKNVIAEGDLNSIVADALGQLGSIINNPAQQEAKRLIEKSLNSNSFWRSLRRRLLGFHKTRSAPSFISSACAVDLSKRD